MFAFSPDVPLEDTQLILNRPDADFDDNGDFDCIDVDALTAEIAAETNATYFDLNGDGNVDVADLGQWLADAGAATLPSRASYQFGDANLDGRVDVTDFNIWNANQFTDNSAWCSGNFNGDANTDTSDFKIWNQNKFSSAARPVPEPDGCLLMLLGFVSIFLPIASGRRSLA